jgi:hypothetical protein
MGVDRGPRRASRSAGCGRNKQLWRPGSALGVVSGWIAVGRRGFLGVLASAPISRRPLTELNVRVLRALEPSRYQTIDVVRQLLSVRRSVARAELTRLRDQELVEDNGEHPLAFRRTVLGDEALKWFV